MAEESMIHYVYVMDDSPYGSKIGYSKNPEQRLKAIRGCNPRDVKIIYQYQVDSWDDADELEKKLHKQFDSKRIRKRNEWFDINNDDLSEIVKTCDAYYSDYTTYKNIDEWIEDTKPSNLFEKYYSPFKMPKIHKRLPDKQKIIFCDDRWNKIFHKYFGKKAKESYKYLQKKYEILNELYRYNINDIVSIWESDFHLCKRSGLKWDEELEQYLHFFYNYDWYIRKDGFELLNMWNIYNNIPFTINHSNEMLYQSNIESTIYEGFREFVDKIVSDEIVSNMLYGDNSTGKKIRFTEDHRFNMSDGEITFADIIFPTKFSFVESYINNFVMKIVGHKDQYTTYCCGIREGVKVSIQKHHQELIKNKHFCIPLAHKHHIAGNNKFCLDNMSELHRQFLTEGFKKIYNIDLVYIEESLGLLGFDEKTL